MSIFATKVFKRMSQFCIFPTIGTAKIAEKAGLDERIAVNYIGLYLEQHPNIRLTSIDPKDFRAFVDNQRSNPNAVEPVVPEIQHKKGTSPIEPVKNTKFALRIVHTPVKGEEKEYLHDFFEYYKSSVEELPNDININAVVKTANDAFEVLKILSKLMIRSSAIENFPNAIRIFEAQKKQERSEQPPVMKLDNGLVTHITYTPKGKERQTYSIQRNGDKLKFVNKDGKEVFKEDAKDRRALLSNVAIKERRAVIVTHKERRYVVFNTNEIISVTTKDRMNWGEENGDRKAILEAAKIAFDKLKTQQPSSQQGSTSNSKPKGWAKKADNSYEVSTQGDKRFSALNATFKDGTTIQIGDENVDVSGMTIENVYQNLVKKSKKGLAPSKDSILYNESLSTPEDREDYSYAKGYLPLWEKWAEQHPEEIEDLRRKSAGKTLTDQFASTRVSQARALYDILTSNDDKAVLRQVLRHEIKDLGLKLHFKSEAEAFLKKSGGKGTMAAINQKPKTLEEILSPHTIQAINTGKWDNESIEEFNNLITDIQNEKIIYRRIHEESRPYSRGISEAHAGASSILGGSERASKNEQRNTQTKRTPKEQLEEDARKGKEQERIIEAWAKAEDLWLNDYTDEEGNKAATLESLLNSQWDYINQGSEAEVYLYDNKTVLKSISLLHSNDNVAKALDKIALFNHLFPRTAMQVVGFGRDSLGHFRIIVTQPYVKGKELTDEELDNFIKQLDVSSQEGFFLSSDKKIRITDLGNYNILKDKDGNYFVIDADVEYLTPENGGNAVFENTFEPNINTGDNDVYMFIGKKAREKYAEIIKRTRPDLDEKGIKATLDFLHSLEDTKENTAYIKAAIQWITNGSITLPEDNQVAKDIFDEVRKRHVDISKYKKLSDLLQSKEMQPKENEKYPFDINKEKAFSNHQTRTTKGGRVFEVYDVENTTEGIRAVCHAIAGSYTASPWCLSTFTSKGEPTGSAKKFWKKYDKIPRKIAFENGKPVAFSSDDRADFPEAWWDLNDKDTQPELNDNINNSYKGFEDNSETKIKARIRRENIIREEKHIATNIAVMNKAKPLEKQLLEILRDKETLIKFLNAISRDDYAYSSNTQNPVGLYIFVRDYMFEPDSEMPMSIYSNKELIDLANAYKNFSSEDFKVFEEKKYNQTLNDTYFFTTPQGEIYGFVTKNGEIYLDETKISPEHPIHEYTHLWDMVVQKKNPELWQRGVELLKQTDQWKEIENDDNYGGKWKQLLDDKKIDQEKYDNLIASEVHARLVGKGGEDFLNKQAEKRGKAGLIAKIKAWLKEFWDSLKKTLSPWSNEDLSNLDLKTFNNMTLRDFFFNDINIADQLAELNSGEQPQQKAGKTVIPNKGNTENEIDEDAPEWRIARNLTTIQRRELVSDIRQSFSEKISNGIEDMIDKLQDDLSKAQMDGDLNEVNSIKHQIALLQDGFKGRKAFLQIEGHTPIDIFKEIHDDFVVFQRNVKYSIDSILKKSNLSDEDKENIKTYQNQKAILDSILGSQTLENDDLFEVLLRDACTELDWYENVKITFDSKNNTSSVQDSTEDDDAQKKSLDDDPEGDAVAGNAGWVYEARFVDPRTTQSYITKKILSTIPLLNEKGLPQSDFLGIYAKYLNHGYVHAVLLDELSSMTDPRDFAYKDEDGKWVFPALTKVAQKYPWAQGIIDQLTENPEYIPVFFSDFRKDFIKYWMQYFDLKEDKWKTKRLNTRSAEESMYAQVRTNFEQGVALDEDSIFRSPGTLNKAGAEKVKELSDEFNKCLNSDNVLYHESYAKKAAKYATKALRIVGVDVTANAVESMLRDENQQHNVINAVQFADDIALAIVNNKKSKATKTEISEITNSDDIVVTFRNQYKEIAKNIGGMSSNTNVGTFRQNGKQYYSYSAPNYADTLFKDLLNDEKRQGVLDSKFKSDNWFYDKEMPITDEMAEQIKEESTFDSKNEEHVVFNRSTLQWTVVPFEGNEAQQIDAREYAKEKNEIVQSILNRMRWQNQWLYLIENDGQARFDFETKELKIIKDTKNDWAGKHNDFKDWLPAEAQAALLFEYFSQTQLDDRLGCYNFPNFSDAGIMKFVIAPKYYIDELKHMLAGVAVQELKRMKFVARRKAAMEDPNIAPQDKPAPIQYFDKNGSKFNFFDEFNNYLVSIDESTGEYTIYDSTMDEIPEEGVYNMTEILQEALDNEEFDKVYYILQEAVTRSMHDKINSFMVNVIGDVTIDEYGEPKFSGSAGNRIYKVLIDTGRIDLKQVYYNIKNAGKEAAAKNLRDQIRSSIKEYVWNQGFASTQIIEILCKDLAFFKNGNDFQKRFKQVYAAGDRMFTGSEYGQESYDSITLTDSEMTSPSYIDIAQSTAGDVKAGRMTEAERDTILNAARHINMADGQAYRSLDGIRCILNMRGQWTDAMKEAYERITQGEWTSADLEIIWQSIKPFVYTMLDKPDGLGGTMKVPFQAKDSEFALLSAYIAIATGGSVNNEANTTVSPKLKALARFMQERGIHVAQFQSAVKVGDMANVNLNFSDNKLRQWAKENGEKAGVSENDSVDKLAEAYKDYMDKQLTEGKITQKQYNIAIEGMQPTEEEAYEALNNAAFPGSSKSRDAYGRLVMRGGTKSQQVVSTISYNDYMMQQPTPEDIIDKEVIFGSQIRTNIVADLPEDFEVTINGKKYNKQTIKEVYNRTIISNLNEDFKKLKKIFGSIENLRDAIINIIDGNPKYGRDMIEALNIVEQDDGKGGKMKVFALPLDNPSTTMKMQVIVNSFFKNRITKQHIRGGACILVSSFGYSNKLHTVYNKDGSIRYFECYMPASSKKLYEPLMEYDENGNPYLDIDRLPEPLRRAVGYRIPTEDKCSMVHLRIKGFLPQNNGSSIMLPMEAMFFSGEDFDVDKKYLMMPAFRIQRYDIQRARRDFARADSEVDKAIKEYFTSKEGSNPDAVAFLDKLFGEDADENTDENATTEGSTKKDKTKQAWREWWKNNKEKYRLETPIIEKIRYDVNKSPEKQSREARDNMIIDIIQAILGNRDTASKIQNPSNYLDVKRESRMYKILAEDYLINKWAEYKSVAYNEVADSLLNASLDEMQDFLNKYERQRSWLDPQTFVYYHRQNMQGKKLTGILANNVSQQCKFQETGLSLKADFELDGVKYQKLDLVISPNGERISKNCSKILAAAPDTAKDPTLADLNMFDNSADIGGTLLRLGLTIKQMALFLHQPIISKWIEEGKNDTTSLYNAISEEALMNMEMDDGEFKDIMTRKKKFTSQELLNNILKWKFSDRTHEDNVKIIEAAAFVYNITKAAKDLFDVTLNSKYDTSNGAIDISAAGVYSQILAVQNLKKEAKYKQDYTLSGTECLIKNNVILGLTGSDAIDELMKQSMPLQQAFYSMGVESAMKLQKPYMTQFSETAREIVKRIDKNSPALSIPKRNVSALLNDMIYFYLTGGKQFGGQENASYSQRRKAFLKDFPNEFLEFIRNHPDIGNMNAIRKMGVRDGELVIVDVDKMTEIERDGYKREIETLALVHNDEIKKFAKNLFMYSFYKDGLSFGPKSISSFFSTKFIESFPAYMSDLRNMAIDFASMTKEERDLFADRFIAQFYANRIEMSMYVPVFSTEAINAAPDWRTGEMVVSSGSEKIKNWKAGNAYYDYIGIKVQQGTFYFRFDRMNPDGSVLYKQIDTITNDVSSRYYDASRDITDIVDENKAEIEEMKQNAKNARIRSKASFDSEFDDAMPETGVPIDDLDISAEELDDIKQFGKNDDDDPLQFYVEKAKEDNHNSSVITDNGKEKDYSTEGGEATLEQNLCK